MTTINGSTFAVINDTITESVTCVVNVPPPQGFYLQVLTDSGSPVSGLAVTIQSSPNASCNPNGVNLTNTVEVTNSSGWILFQGWLYYFVITYSGHTYYFTVPSSPMAWSIATISVPSGVLVFNKCGIGGGNLTSFCQTKTTTTVSSTLGQYAYASDINSSNPCTYTNETASSIVSNIENYPEFISLEGNRTYTLDGYGCSMSNPTGTNATYQSIISFRYYDWAHSIYWQCGNETVSQPTYYQITVTLALTPTGYNLANSTFQSRLVPPFEGCPNFNATSSG